MIKSMTGFAAVTHEAERATIGVTIRSLNHRHLDLQLRLPSMLAGLENEVRALVSKRIARGRVEVAMSLQLRHTPGIEVELNEQFALALEAALQRARERGLIAGTLTPGDLIRLPQALTIRERPADADDTLVEDVAGQARHALDLALTELDSMRVLEGEHLRANLDERRTAAATLVEQIAVAADEGRAGVEERLAARVHELKADLLAEETTVAQEIIRVAARSDISEETARFRGHVSHWVTLADSPEPCGRKLEFLLQEMNREVNTMGSKADGLRVSELVISAKAELEKMREQVQNVE
jgi:uncharacterized protein (TIGR00255 family)